MSSFPAHFRIFDILRDKGEKKEVKSLERKVVHYFKDGSYLQQLIIYIYIYISRLKVCSFKSFS